MYVPLPREREIRLCDNSTDLIVVLNLLNHIMRLYFEREPEFVLSFWRKTSLHNFLYPWWSDEVIYIVQGCGLS